MATLRIGNNLISGVGPTNVIAQDIAYDNSASSLAGTDVQTAIDNLKAITDGLSAGGSDGVISNVALNALSLDFTGTGGGFNGSVDLSNFSTLDGNNNFIGSNSFRNNIFTNITSADEWQIVSENAETPNLILQMADGGFGSPTSIIQYTLNGSGVPSAATDLIDKAFADATYLGAGSQNLSQVLTEGNDAGNNDIDNVGSIIFQDKGSNNTDKWTITEVSSGVYEGDLSFSEGIFTVAALPLDGVIDQDLHLATKAYVDANSGGGSGTVFNDLYIDVPVGAIDGVNTTYTVQESEYASNRLVVFVNGIANTVGTGLVETTPGSGIFDLDTAPPPGAQVVCHYSVSSSTAVDIEAKIDNENLFKFTNQTTTKVPSGDDIEISTGLDIGKKTILYSQGTDQTVFILDGSHSEGESIVLANLSATSQIEVVPDDGDINIYIEGNNNINNAVRLDEIGQMCTVLKTNITDTYIISGGTPFTENVSAPTVSSATVESGDPDALVVVFSKPVTVTNLTGLSLDGSWTGVTFSSIQSGNGTNTVTFDLDTDIVGGETGNFVYSVSNTITDLALRPLAGGNTAVTNNTAGGGTELFTTANAASDPNGNEVDGTNGLTNDAGTFSSQSGTVNTGSFALQHVAGGANGHKFHFSFNVTSGNTYTFTCNAQQTIGTTGIIHTTGGTSLVTGEPNFAPISESGWNPETFVMTATGSGEVEISFYSANGGSIGDTIFVDNISVIETT